MYSSVLVHELKLSLKRDLNDLLLCLSNQYNVGSVSCFSSTKALNLDAIYMNYALLMYGFLALRICILGSHKN